jgi:hypothetical protein
VDSSDESPPANAPWAAVGAALVPVEQPLARTAQLRKIGQKTERMERTTICLQGVEKLGAKGFEMILSTPTAYPFVPRLDGDDVLFSE